MKIMSGTLFLQFTYLTAQHLKLGLDTLQLRIAIEGTAKAAVPRVSSGCLS